MLGIINDTLERRTKPSEHASGQANGEEFPPNVDGAQETNGNKEEPIDVAAHGIGAVTLSHETPPPAQHQQ